MRNRSKNIILKFPKMSEITIKSSNGWSNTAIVISIYSAKDPTNRYDRRKSYSILEIGYEGLDLQYISHWCSEHLGIDNTTRKLVMDRIDML